MSPTAAASASVRPTGRVRRVGLTAVAVVLLGLVVAAAAFCVTGGRFFVVRTPSMGTAAPVGSLVLTRPVSLADLHVGDIIAYHPPTEQGETYTHRIVAVTAQGLRTRGDINGATDPWVVTQHDIVGRATAIPALGWLMRALPLLLVGGLVIWGLTALWVAPGSRGPIRMTGMSLLFALCDFLLKPFVNVVQLETQSTSHGAYIRAVSTGLLPIRLTPAAGHGNAAPVDLSRAGVVGTSRFTGGRPGTQFLLQAHLHLTVLEWMLLGLFCAAPLLWTLLIGFRPAEAERSRHRRQYAVAI